MVEEPNEKFFVTAFIKGLRSGTFSEALIMWKPLPMDEVRVRVENHIETEQSNAGKREKESGMQGPRAHRTTTLSVEPEKRHR